MIPKAASPVSAPRHAILCAPTSWPSSASRTCASCPAVQALEGTGIPVAAVSTAFPHGLAPVETKLREIELSVADGAREIDIVIERGMVLRGDWQALYDQVKAFRKACGDAHIKTILGTGELATQTNIAKASLVCMLAGADFIKTSTGKEKVNANLVTSLTMIRMIRWLRS
jgi:deoxyribose-phosphate aldolase